MLPTTADCIRSILRADASLTPGERTRILAHLRNGNASPKAQSAEGPRPRIIRRGEAARLLSASVRLVDRLTQQGALRKVHLPGRTRAAGFLEADILQLIAGNSANGSAEPESTAAAA